MLVAAGTNLFGIDAATGRQLWQMASPNGQPFGPPVLDYDGTLYAPVTGGMLALHLRAGPSLNGWPMDRQNPRRSACLERGAAPRILAVRDVSAEAAVEVMAPGGGIVLTSLDLRSWQRLAFQPAQELPMRYTLETTNHPAAFYRVLAP